MTEKLEPGKKYALVILSYPENTKFSLKEFSSIEYKDHKLLGSKTTVYKIEHTQILSGEEVKAIMEKAP